MSHNNKICCVIPSLQPGGMERVMSVLINGFIQQYDADVHIVLYGASRGVFYELDKRAHIYTPQWDFDLSHRTRDTLKTILFLRKTIKHLKADAILSFGSRWNSLVLLSCLGLRLPIFISDRGTPIRSDKGFHAKMKHLLYPFAKGIIVQTQTAKDIYQQKYRQKNYCVIGNPIRSITVPENNVRDNTVVSVARLVDTKNFDRLINVFEAIGNNDWILKIVGGNADGQHVMEELQAQREKSPMKDNILLAGTQKDVDSYLLKAKVFAFTSSEEGFPNAIGEAMSAGLPVVSYNCMTGPSEMIEDGENGYLVDVFDDATFTKKLQQLMSDDNLRSVMGQYAQKSIKRFSEERIVGQFYEFITNSKKQ